MTDLRDEIEATCERVKFGNASPPNATDAILSLIGWRGGVYPSDEAYSQALAVFKELFLAGVGFDECLSKALRLAYAVDFPGTVAKP